MRQSIYGIVLYVILLIPPIITFLESKMVLHMLVQMPLLILAGYLMGQFLMKDYYKSFAKWNRNGIPGILLVVIVTMYWMIPRTMDESILFYSVEIFKFISLPFLVGVPLRDSWQKLSSLGRSFVIFNYIPMFGMMAWLYINSPIQVCNNYLEVEQKLLGWGFLLITAAMVIYIIQFAFTDRTEHS